MKEKDFFEKKSKEELDVMLELYKTICGDKIIGNSCYGNDEDIRIYTLARDKKR